MTPGARGSGGSTKRTHTTAAEPPAVIPAEPEADDPDHGGPVAPLAVEPLAIDAPRSSAAAPKGPAVSPAEPAAAILAEAAAQRVLARSLVISGTMALIIGLAGILMVGLRRRGW